MLDNLISAEDMSKITVQVSEKIVNGLQRHEEYLLAGLLLVYEHQIIIFEDIAQVYYTLMLQHGYSDTNTIQVNLTLKSESEKMTQSA